jgi:excinuclease ABC subunit C
LKLIQQLRDEAHRYGLSKHRNRRSKAAIQTELTQIKGLGTKSAEKLLKALGSVEKIKNADISLLTEVVTLKQAQLIQSYFKGFQREQ